MEALEYLQKYSRIRKKDLVLMLRILSLTHYEVQCNIVNCFHVEFKNTIVVFFCGHI